MKKSKIIIASLVGLLALGGCGTKESSSSSII